MLTTNSLYANATSLTGTGTINTNGLVTDANLVFDSTHGASQIVPGFGSVTMNLDVSNPSTAGDLGVGYKGSGALTIRNGIRVYSFVGLIGFLSGSTGIATVDGEARTGQARGISPSATSAVGRSRSPTAAPSATRVATSACGPVPRAW